MDGKVSICGVEYFPGNPQYKGIKNLPFYNIKLTFAADFPEPVLELEEILFDKAIGLHGKNLITTKETIFSLSKLLHSHDNKIHTFQVGFSGLTPEVRGIKEIKGTVLVRKGHKTKTLWLNFPKLIKGAESKMNAAMIMNVSLFMGDKELNVNLSVDVPVSHIKSIQAFDQKRNPLEMDVEFNYRRFIAYDNNVNLSIKSEMLSGILIKLEVYSQTELVKVPFTISKYRWGKY
ncbi:MAG: hypothetical protein HRT89_15100 [Lentisphaeria bacterium]|nr:hypothetical protein [Lentisphaeria bacterium]